MIKKITRRSRKILIGVGIFFFAYTVVGFLIFPIVLKSILSKKLSETMARVVTIEKIRFNPYNLKLSIIGFDIKQKTHEGSFIAFDELFLNIESISIFKRGLVVKEVRLSRPRLAIIRNDEMTYNFSDLIPQSDENKNSAPKDAQEDGYKFSINNIQIINGSIDINDRPKKTEHRAREMTLNIPLISNLPYDVDIFVEPSFSVIFNDTPFGFKGTTKPFINSRETSVGIKLTALDLPYYMAYSPFPLDFRLASGKADLDINISYRQFSDSPAKLILKGAFELKDVDIEDLAGHSMVKLPLLSMDIAEAELFIQKVHLTSIFIEKPVVMAERNREGIMNLMKLLPKAPADVAAPETGEKMSPFILDVDRIELVKGAIHFTDYQPGTPFKRSLDPLSLVIEGFTTSASKKANLKLSFKNTAGESINVKGGFSINPVSVEMKFEVKKINLVPMQSYIEDTLNLVIKRGYAGASGELKAAFQEGGGLKASFKGRSSLSDLWAIDRLKADDFMKLKSFTVKGIDLDYDPARLSCEVSAVAISDFYIRVIVGSDGKINLGEILATKKTEAETTPPFAPETKKESALDIKIKKVRFMRGSLNFTDRLINPRYSTDVVEIGGSISGLTSDANKKADVNISAMIDRHAPLTITGKINPLSEDLFVDLKVDFKNFELSSVSPYSGKYIGNSIARGKLFLDLQYHIENKKLESQNNVLIDRITLGEKVDSPDATALPVGFALSLLKDRAGKINIKLPVSGSLDNPEFRVGGIIVKMVVNLFLKAATSPFALLGAIIGGGEEMSYVEFVAGGATLAEGNTRKLDTLINALYERPGLNLEIEGYVDVDEDTEGIRNSRFLRKIKEQKFKKVVKRQPDITVDEIVIEGEEYDKYLWRAYKKEKFKKLRNVVGLTKKITTPEMEKLILDHIEITKDDLRGLSKARSQTVKDYVISSGKVKQERLFIVWPDSVTKKAKGGVRNSRVDFKLK